MATIYDRNIYRNGEVVKKAYRDGELIYQKVVSPTPAPEPPTPTENWVDLTTIDNETPIYNIAWKSDQGFSTINDTWFSEASGLTTDSYVDDSSSGWRNGKTEATGYYTYHRMSNTHKKYSCTFLDQYYTGNGSTVEYGVAMTDANINSLPTGVINGETYYMLNIVDWQNWKPLYMPLSTSKIQSTYVEGMIMVDIVPKE